MLAFWASFMINPLSTLIDSQGYSGRWMHGGPHFLEWIIYVFLSLLKYLAFIYDIILIY